MPRAYTKEEARSAFLADIRSMVRYWAKDVEGASVEVRCGGVAFSILSLIDGCRSFPACDIVLRPHPDDKEFHIEEGDDYYEDGMSINGEELLHELFYRRKASDDQTP